jgi:CRISPR/Cas system CMR-associated protein Cmr5 small subunit
MTVWQDSLLSLCYDRPSMVSTRGWQLDLTTLESNVSYTDMMRYLCRLGLQINNSDERDRNDLIYCHKSLAELDSVFKLVNPTSFHENTVRVCTSTRNIWPSASMFPSVFPCYVGQPSNAHPEPLSTHVFEFCAIGPKKVWLGLQRPSSTLKL